MTPLHHASEGGHDSIVDMLLQRPEIDVNARNAAGETPIFLAAKAGRMKVVEMLLKAETSTSGAAAVDETIADARGVTPRQIARQNQHEEIVKLLEKVQHK